MQPLLLPALSPRKAAIVGLTPRVTVGCEIGADHGIISAHLLREGICARMIVSDISAASLEKAKLRFSLHGLSARACFRVADGLSALDGPVGAIVIAGMGGETIMEILGNGLDAIGGASLVLQANTDLQLLRGWLSAHGFRIDAESLAREGRRLYVAMRAARGTEALDALDLFLGPRLRRDKPPLYAEYLQWKIGCLRRDRSEEAARMLRRIEGE